MKCFYCGQPTAQQDAAEVYSLESCMCEPCHKKFQIWSINEGVDPTTGEQFPERKETVN